MELKNNLNNNINDLTQKSYYKILDFKYELNTLYELIFKFCQNNNIILSNNNINLSIINNYQYKIQDIENDFNFNLLSSNPYKHSIDLSNIIYKEYSKYVVLSSYINKKEIIISVDNNRIIKFNLLFLNSNEIVNKLKIPILSLNFKNNKYKLNYLPNIIELLFLTHKIYHPSNFIKYLKNEKYNIINDTNIIGFSLKDIYNNYINYIININYIYDTKNFNELRFNINNYIIKSINSDLYTDLSIILLDNYAISFYKNNKITNYNDIIQIIINKQYIQHLLNIINNYLENNNLLNKNKIEIKQSNIYIMNDFRLQKNTISLYNKDTNKNTILVITYNSLDYEVIPIVYKINKCLIPHPIVLIRFLLLNLVNLQLFDKSYNINIYYNTINKIKVLYEIESKINLDIINKKNIIEYHGIYIDERIDKFKFGIDIYRPWQYKIKNNTLLFLK